MRMANQAFLLEFTGGDPWEYSSKISSCVEVNVAGDKRPNLRRKSFWGRKKNVFVFPAGWSLAHVHSTSKTRLHFIPSFLKALHASELPLAEIQAVQVLFSLSLYFILIVLWPFLCHLSACLITKAFPCEELALISQVLSKGKQWSWRKIRVSKFATSLLMFHLTQRCMKGFWQE